MKLRKKSIVTLAIIILSVFSLLFAGCSIFKVKKQSSVSKPVKTVSKGPAPLYYDFEDVLIPGELKVNKKESFIYSSSGFSVGVLVLSGRVDLNSLIAFFENNMAKDNWKMICSFNSAYTLMLFQKENRWCAVSLNESNFATHARIWVAPTIS